MTRQLYEVLGVFSINLPNGRLATSFTDDSTFSRTCAFFWVWGKVQLDRDRRIGEIAVATVNLN
jgi:hypothetical protein